MNKTAKEAEEFIKNISESVKDSKDIVVCGVPFVCIPDALKAAEGTNIEIAAQNMHYEENGAYTGEVSAPMLYDLGVKYVIIGHSERRQYFSETDETVNRKVHTAFKYGLRPIICVGESLEQREMGVTEDLINYQVKIALNGLSSEQVKNVIIAYEPIWAIGTGKTATSKQANDVCLSIRNTVAKLYNKETANTMVIQYGGSVKPDNVDELFNMDDIDGGLIGGASLKADDFIKIVNYKKN